MRIVKPSNALPALPMKTRARGCHGRRRFINRKPSTDPENTNRACASTSLPEYKAAPTNMHSEAKTVQPASPSTPSHMLIALITPTVTNIISGSVRIP